MVIDAHQHFWTYNEKEFGWIDKRMESLKRDFLPEDLKPELLNSGIDGTIAVQARQSLEETRWLIDLALQNCFINGVVGWVDLCSEDIHNQLTEFSSHPKFVGVRHVVHDEHDDDFILSKDFMNGIGMLKNFKLTYDILVFPKHLKNAIRFVQHFPDQVFILDHFAKPFIKEQKISPWKEEIAELAKFQNVYCKISGLVTEANWHQWKEIDFRQYLDIDTESFGINRLLVGSDWPVSTLCGSYSKVMDIVRNYYSQFSESEKELIFGLNAAKIYLRN